MNARVILFSLGSATAVYLSGCCSLDDAFEPRKSAPSQAPKKPLAQANSPALKQPQSVDPQSTTDSIAAIGASVTSTRGQTAPNTSRLNQLDSEELSIRNNRALSTVERNQQLQRIWKEQLDARAGIQSKDTSSSQQRPASQIAPASPSQTVPPIPHTPSQQPAPSVASAPKADEPKYAIKMPGKSGIIKSPYDGKLLDATGVPPGTEVKDPSSGKIMLVP